MSSTLCCLVSISVLIFLPISYSSSLDLIDWDTQSRINRICQKSFDYYICRDIFNRNLKSPVADYRGLTKIALSQTLLFTTETLVFIKKLERKAKNQTQRDLFKICIVGYDLLLDQFTQAYFAFGKNDINSVLFAVGNCERFVTGCETALGNVTAVHDKNTKGRVLVRMSNASAGLIGQELM